MPLQLRTHLRRGRAAKGVAGVQAAAQAQALVHILADLGLEFLQHRQGKF